MAISSSEMHDFSLRDLHTFCVCIMLTKIISPKLDVTKILLKVYMNMFTVPNLTVQPGSLLGRYMKHYSNLKIFKASALWADAFYKSKCPSVCMFVCLFTFEVPFNGLFAPTS